MPSTRAVSILVTGGTKDIELEIALRFSTPGSAVFLNYLTDDDAAATASQQVERRGARCIPLKQGCGTGRGEAISRLRCITRPAARSSGPLRSACHFQAAAPHRPSRVYGSSESQRLGIVLPRAGRNAHSWSKIYRSLYHEPRRRIVVPNYAAAGVAKPLAEALMRYLCVELVPRGLRINAIGPSIVNTQAVRQVFGAENAETMVRQNAEQNPSSRGICPDDYARLIEFLASPSAEFIQGQVIFVNGGHHVMA